MQTTLNRPARHLSLVTATTTPVHGQTADDIVDAAQAAALSPLHDDDRAEALARARRRLADGDTLEAVVLDAWRDGYVAGDTTRALTDRHQIRTSALQLATLEQLLDHRALVGA